MGRRMGYSRGCPGASVCRPFGIWILGFGVLRLFWFFLLMVSGFEGVGAAQLVC